MLTHHESLEGRNTQPLSFAWSRSEQTPAQPLSAPLAAAGADLWLSQMSLFLPSQSQSDPLLCLLGDLAHAEPLPASVSQPFKWQEVN